MKEPEHDSYDICPVCFWEDDGLQYGEPDYEGGANHVSLRQARDNFEKFGACDEGSVSFVRRARFYERPRRLLPI